MAKKPEIKTTAQMIADYEKAEAKREAARDRQRRHRETKKSVTAKGGITPPTTIPFEQKKARIKRVTVTHKEDGDLVIADAIGDVTPKKRPKPAKEATTSALEINDHHTNLDNPDTRTYETTLQPRHWKFAEGKAAALRMSMPHYLEWLVRRDHQLDPLRRELANSRTISGEAIVGRQPIV